MCQTGYEQSPFGSLRSAFNKASSSLLLTNGFAANAVLSVQDYSNGGLAEVTSQISLRVYRWVLFGLQVPVGIEVDELVSPVFVEAQFGELLQTGSQNYCVRKGNSLPSANTCNSYL